MSAKDPEHKKQPAASFRKLGTDSASFYWLKRSTPVAPNAFCGNQIRKYSPGRGPEEEGTESFGSVACMRRSMSPDPFGPGPICGPTAPGRAYGQGALT